MFKKIVYVLLIALLLSGVACKEKSAVEPKQKEEVKMVTEEKAWKAPAGPDVDAGKKYTATIKTEKGDIVCELFAKEAPFSVTNFKYLADNGFYKGLTFHRVVPGFVIQGGDPTATGSGGPGYTIPAEISKLHNAGALAWARTGDQVNPERRSSGSQFYITYTPTPQLDGAYTVFGQTIKGMDIVNKIERGDKILDVVVNEQ